MTRIAIIDRADMNDEQAKVYDWANDSGGVVGGPYYAYIRLPQLFEASQNLRTCLWSGPLSKRERQIANITIARHWGAEYPWFAQVRVGLEVGIDRTVIEAINEGLTPDLPDARERACFMVPRELLNSRKLSDASYAAAEEALGLEDFVALVALTGTFSMTCITANTFEVDAPQENPVPLKS